MRNADYLCELLSPISPVEAQGFLADPRYWMQVKEDGFRLVIERYAGALVGFDRYGVITAIPKHLQARLDAFADEYMIDGELVGFGPDARYVTWDILSLDGDDLRDRPYAERLEALYERLDTPDDLFHVVPTWTCGLKETSRILLELYEKGAEGVVFKDTLALFQPGRAEQHYKLKFWESATCRVADKAARADARMDKHSIAIELHDRTRWVAMGFVPIPRSEPLPAVGSIVEVRYLYAQSDGLYQGVCLGVRRDARLEDCTLEQLKWQRPSSQSFHRLSSRQ